MDSKKLVLLLPLLLTACSSVQLKQVNPQHAPTMIHLQPPTKTAPAINAVRCMDEGPWRGGYVPVSRCDIDVMRNLDKGQTVTVYFTHGDRRRDFEGIFSNLTLDDQLVLTVLLGFDKMNNPILVNAYIPVEMIDFVLVNGN